MRVAGVFFWSHRLMLLQIFEVSPTRAKKSVIDICIADIIAITETWFHSGVHCSDILLNYISTEFLAVTALRA